MPRKRGRKRKSVVSAIPETHEWMHGNFIATEWDEQRNLSKTLGQGCCRQCYFDSIPKPGMNGNGRVNRVMAAGHRRGGMPPIQTVYGCSRCKVNICSEECHKKWNHAHCTAGTTSDVTVCCGVATTARQ